MMNITDNNVPFEEIKKAFDLIKSLVGGDNGTYEDTMPEGCGEFGLDVTNPIPVDTIVGNRMYLERLQTTEGKKISYERIGQFQAPNIPSIIDGYRIFVKGKEITKLYICPYNKKNTERAPKGFKLV